MRIVHSTDFITKSCERCKSILELNKEDISFSDVGHPCDYWFNCPVCGKFNQITTVPKHWDYYLDPD